MKNIVITGFMASGKTTVARYLSQITGMKIIDTDVLIETLENRTINEIFRQEGEKYFRNKEKDISEMLAKEKDIIISTGGGFVLNTGNINNLRENGIVFLLDADFSVIESRIEKARAVRPVMNGKSIEEIKELFEERRRFYNNCDYKIHVGNTNTPSELAKKILDIYEKE